MKMYSCIIVEDEFPAIELLKSYISNFDNLSLDGVFTDPIAASLYLTNHPVDVLFLDIQLPKLNGMELLKSIPKPPFVVITSAYSEHAVNAFELTVFDYLLKPYSLQRFVQTINRIQSQQSSIPVVPSITIKESRKNIKIPISAICFVESQREYVLIYQENEVVKTKMTISAIDELLPASEFVRIHRSFLVSLNRITSFTMSSVTVLDKELPIGRYYKKEALTKIESDL